MCDNLPPVAHDDLLTRSNDLRLTYNDGPPPDCQASSSDLHKADLTPSICTYQDTATVLSLQDFPHIDSLEVLQPLQSFPHQTPCAQEVFTLLPHGQGGIPSSTAMTLQTSEVTHTSGVTSGVSNHGRVKERKKKCKSVYKHVPHREKPPHLVARRNARERRRVQSVNVAFARLRRVVPGTSGRSKRVSKVKILQGAIDYIYHLQDLLEKDGVPFSNNNCSSLHHGSDDFVHTSTGVREGGEEVMRAGGAAVGPQEHSPTRPLLQEDPSQDSIGSFLSYGSDGGEGSGWSDAEELGESEYLEGCISQELISEY